jgi:phosphate transport system substrate-binding protein
MGLTLLLVAACGALSPAAPTPEPLNGTYTASGGGGGLPAVQALAARFKELHPETNWIISESGSHAAFKLVVSNTIDIGFVSRALTDAELEQVTGVPIGFSGTAVLVNAANSVTNLSKEQLRQIYSGEVMNWSQLGGFDQLIRPFVAQRNAATRQTLEAFLFPGAIPTYGKNVQEQMEAEVMFTAVNSFRGAIGVAPTGSRTASDTRVRVIRIDGVAPTQENITRSVYEMVRPLAVIYSNTVQLRPGIRAFVEFVKSPEGQRIAAAAF